MMYYLRKIIWLTLTLLLLNPVCAANEKQEASVAVVEKNEQISDIKLAANITTLVVLILIWVKNSCSQSGKITSDAYEFPDFAHLKMMQKKEIVQKNTPITPTTNSSILPKKEKDPPGDDIAGSGQDDVKANQLLDPTSVAKPIVPEEKKDPPKDDTKENEKDQVKANQLSDSVEKNPPKDLEIKQKNLLPGNAASETTPAKEKEDSSTDQNQIINYFSSDSTDDGNLSEELTYERIIRDESFFSRDAEEEALFAAIIDKGPQKAKKRKKRFSFRRKNRKNTSTA